MLTPKSRTYAGLDPSYRHRGMDTRYIAYRALPVVSRPFNGWVISRKLLAAVKEYAPEVILSYVVYPDGYAAVRIGKQLGVPVVLTAIGSDLNRISDRLTARHTRYALRHATWTTTVSGDLLKTARRMGANPLHSTAILNGCDTSIFHPRDRQQARETLQVPSDAEVIVYVGRMDVRKGLAELIAAAASLRDQRPRLRCYLVGEGADKPALMELVNKHQAQQEVFFVASCPTERVAQWMAAADLVTLPSYKEGCPNVVIEALASGRPVVATSVGGIPELMDDRSGRLIPPQDVDSLAAALNEVLGGRWDPSELARHHARSWADAAKELDSVMEQAVGEGAQGTRCSPCGTV
jgi:glycosyltransferase involved in cell wall biosynthesis